MERVVTRHGEVAVEVRGRGRPLVLLHSNGHDRRDYEAIVGELSRSFQTIAVDWPGHGASTMWVDPRSASVPAMCEVLSDLVDAMKLPAAVFVGNSVGGTAALHLAATRPERARALVLVDTGGISGTAAPVRAFCWLMGREVVRRATGMAFARAYLKVRGASRDAVLARMREARRRPGFVEMDAAMRRSFGTKEADQTARLDRVACPTLVVWGRRDPVIPARPARRVLERGLRDMRWTEFDTGHVPFVEAPEDFLRAVSPFLADHVDSACEQATFAS